MDQLYSSYYGETLGTTEYKDMPIRLVTGIEKTIGISLESTTENPEQLPVSIFQDKPVEPIISLVEVRKHRAETA
jgi:hypothetical protein